MKVLGTFPREDCFVSQFQSSTAETRCCGRSARSIDTAHMHLGHDLCHRSIDLRMEPFAMGGDCNHGIILRGGHSDCATHYGLLLDGLCLRKHRGHAPPHTGEEESRWSSSSDTEFAGELSRFK